MPEETSEQTPVRCSGPGDALDAIPWMLGFTPTESLVMLTLVGPRSRFGPVMRVDLADPTEDSVLVAGTLRLLAGRVECDEVVLVVYTDEGSDDPLAPLPRQGLLLEARRQFAGAGVSLRDAVVVRHGRWWSLLCDDPLCCPPEGTSVAREVPSAVELTYRMSGLTPPMPSRAALADSLRPHPVTEVNAEIERLGPALAGVRTETKVRQLREVVAHAMQQVSSRGRSDLAPAVVALLIVLVQSIPVRDEAVELTGSDGSPGAVALWREIYAATPEAFRSEVGAVLGVLAWQAGASALATCVCESVLALDPGHRLSLLTLTLVSHGIRPDRHPGRAARSVPAMRSGSPARPLRQVLPGRRARRRSGTR